MPNSHTWQITHCPPAAGQWPWEVVSPPGLFNEAARLTAATSLGFEMHGEYIPFPQPLAFWEGRRPGANCGLRKPFLLGAGGSLPELQRIPIHHGHKETEWLLFTTKMMKPKGSSTEPTTYATSIYWAQRKKETNRISTFRVWSFLAITTVLGGGTIVCSIRRGNRG